MILASFLGGMESAFQAIQNIQALLPLALSQSSCGMFWKGSNAQGAVAMLVVSVFANIALKFVAPELAFVIRIWIVFLSCLAVGYFVSNVNKGDDDRAITWAG